MLRELHRERICEAVAKEVKRYILDNGLKPGDKLPSERELCERLKVSHGSLRVGLRLLQGSGLIEIHPGRGTVVREDDLDSFLARAVQPLLDDSADLLDLAETREILETAIARLAAQRRTDDHLERLQDRLESDREKVALAQYGIDEDLAFHTILFQAAGNKMLLRFAGIVSDLGRARRRANLGRPEEPVRTLAEHTAIYEAVRDRKPDAAVRELREHVRTTARAILVLIDQERGSMPDLPEEGDPPTG